MNNNKNRVLAIIALFAIAVLTYSIWSVVVKTVPSTGNLEGDGIICTMEAKQCPDGSWVGRSGPQCQFVCPISVGTSTIVATVETKVNQRITPFVESFTVREVVEDSRCPSDVQCIQAGTIRIRVQTESGLGTGTQVVSLNETITTETESITFFAVKPEKISTINISNDQYRFVFKVSKR